MQARKIDFFESMANDRIKEKIERLKNEKIILNYMIKNNINEFCGASQEEIKEKIERLKDYIRTAQA